MRRGKHQIDPKRTSINTTFEHERQIGRDTLLSSVVSRQRQRNLHASTRAWRFCRRSQFIWPRKLPNGSPFSYCIARRRNGAIQFKQTEISALLFEKIDKLNAKINEGKTGIQYAIATGQADAITNLISKGANATLADDSGEGFLHQGAWSGNLDVVRVLLKHGADPNQKSMTGVTPLHRAAWVGASEVCNELIQSGALIDATDREGVTPLYKAAFQGNLEVVEFLESK